MRLDPGRIVNIADLREAARRSVPRAFFDFIDGAAEDEISLADNRAAFERIRFRPRVLVDVSVIDTSVDLLGKRSSMPLAVAPTGMSGVAWPHAELEMARAAARIGIPYTLSTAASSSIELLAREVGGKLGGRLWFQLYVMREHAINDALMDRARAAGYDTLLVTVDLPVGGKRERDPRNGFSVPFRPNLRMLRDLPLKPGWVMRLLRHGFPKFENLAELERMLRNSESIAGLVARQLDETFDSGKLARIRERWPGKLVVKGLLRADDAEKIARLGVDGVVVSNHGGRQLDGTVAPLDAVPDIVQAVGDRITVLVDGGVRRGSDLIKARALGAQAAMVGRAPLYGVGAGGEPGARLALDILADELLRSMKLLGCRSFAEVSADCIVRAADGVRR